MMTDPSAAEPERPRHPARKWVVATIVFALAAIGLGIWAFTLQSDVDDKDAQIAAQRQQLEQQQDAAGQLQQAAGGLAEDLQQGMSALGDELDQLQGAADASQEQTQEAIEQAEQAAADASDRAEAAEDDVEQARAEADEASARAETLEACARGYLSAIAGAFDAESIDAGIDAARTEFEALSGSCAGVLGSG